MEQAAASTAAVRQVPRAHLEKVQQVFGCLSQTLRAHQLYGPTNPATLRTLALLRTAFEEAWKDLPEIEVWVTSSSFLMLGKPVYQSANPSDSLAFFLFKDGIRTLTFHPGFEREEQQAFVQVLHRARYQPAETDDLVTLLWDEDFVHVRHGYVDVEPEQPEARQQAAELQAGRTRLPLAIARQAFGAGNAEESSPGYDPGAFPGSADPPAKVPAHLPLQRGSLQLGPEALSHLQRQIEDEMRRDVRRDVVNALLDSLEEPDPGAQCEILEVFATFLPGLVAARQLRLTSEILAELRTLGERPGLLDDTRVRELQLLFSEIAASPAVQSVLQALETGEIQSDLDALGGFFVHLGSAFLLPLLRAREKAAGKEVRAALDAAVELMARQYEAALFDALRSKDVLVLRGALRIQCTLGRTDAVPQTVELLQHADERVRLAAVEALVVLGGPMALAGLESSLNDARREVRVAALWGLATWQHAPALGWLREAVESKKLRDIETAEKIAMFDAFARIGGAEAVKPLAKLLNRRSILHPKSPADIRACAARALGLTGSAEARRPLARAQKDRDAEVRRAVQRSLRKLG